MPSKFRLRPLFAPVVRFLARLGIKIHMTPNIATLVMLFCSISAALGLILWGNFLWFGIWIFITGLMDGVDGAIARLSDTSSKFGSFFDSTMDRLSEGVIYTALLIRLDLLAPLSDFWGIVLVGFSALFSFMISYTRARVEIVKKEVGMTFDSNNGLMARSERLFFLFVSSIIAFFVQSFPIFPILLGIYLILCFITFLARYYWYMQHLTKKRS